jgi:hypothetical protein
MFSDPKSNRTHREDIPEEQVHIMAAEEILADYSTKLIVEQFAESNSEFFEKAAPVKYPEVTSERIAALLMLLDGELLAEWEAVINGIEIDLAVSTFANQKISLAKGEEPLEAGVSITISADADVPNYIYLFAQGDKGDIVLPVQTSKPGGPLGIAFSPLRPDQDYYLRIVRIFDPQDTW